MAKKESDLRQKLKQCLKKHNKFVRERLWDSNATDMNYFFLLHPDHYEEVVRDLNTEQLLKVLGTFKSVGKLQILFAAVSNKVWFEKCYYCEPQFLDALPDEKLSEILAANVFNMSDLFDEQTEERQLRMLTLMKKAHLGDWICQLNSLTNLNHFLEWLCDEEENNNQLRKSIAVLFQKLASLDDIVLARLLKGLDKKNVQRILREVNGSQREAVCKVIAPNELYGVIEKSDLFSLEDDPNSKLYALVYERLPEQDKVKFVELLMESVGMGIFNRVPVEMIVDYFVKIDEVARAEFAMKIVTSDIFLEFCGKLPENEKFVFFKDLFKNEETKSELKYYLDNASEPDFVETLFFLLYCKENEQ